MSDKLNTLMNLMNEGIIITDVVGRVYLCNEKARQLMSHRSRVLRGFNIEELLPELDVKSTREKLIKTGDSNLIASAVEIRSGDKVAGHIITLKDFEEAETRQHDMRSKLYGTSHRARYTFEDIIGSSSAIREAVKNGRQMARSDAAVMITGESGTGKEMFAQGIHNESARKIITLWPSTARPYRTACWKARCSGMRKAPLPVRKKAVRRGILNWRIKAPSSLMR